MTKPTNQTGGEWEKEFDKEFTNSYAGDSGLGGNYPQEPVYEWATDNPKDVKDFIRSLLFSLKAKRIERVEKASSHECKEGVKCIRYVDRDVILKLLKEE